MSKRPLKVLVCGDVNGQFDALVKRINNVNKKVLFIIDSLNEFFSIMLMKIMYRLTNTSSSSLKCIVIITVFIFLVRNEFNQCQIFWR